MKKIIIIGNGLIDGYFGNTIDCQFDYVIRLNHFVIDKYEHFIGIRTDIVGMMPYILCDYKLYKNIEEFWIVRPEQHYSVKEQRIQQVLKHYHGKTFKFFDDTYMDIIEYSDNISTGLRSILMAIKEFPNAQIYITGFDSGKYGHYFNLQHCHQKHEWDWEKQTISKLMRQNMIYDIKKLGGIKKSDKK